MKAKKEDCETGIYTEDFHYVGTGASNTEDFRDLRTGNLRSMIAIGQLSTFSLLLHEKGNINTTISNLLMNNQYEHARFKYQHHFNPLSIAIFRHV